MPFQRNPCRSKRKARDKLVEDGRVQELLIGINESETEVCRKVKDKMSMFLGDTSFKYINNHLNNLPFL